MPKKLIRSFKYAGFGAHYVLRTQRNIWIHLIVGSLVLLAAFWLKVSLPETAILVLTFSFVVAAEMFNTAVEEVVNLVKTEKHPQAALAKNIAAGAVLAAAIGAVIVGALIFIPRII